MLEETYPLPLFRCPLLERGKIMERSEKRTCTWPRDGRIFPLFLDNEAGPVHLLCCPIHLSASW